MRIAQWHFLQSCNWTCVQKLLCWFQTQRTCHKSHLSFACLGRPKRSNTPTVLMFILIAVGQLFLYLYLCWSCLTALYVGHDCRTWGTTPKEWFTSSRISSYTQSCFVPVCSWYWFTKKLWCSHSNKWNGNFIYTSSSFSNAKPCSNIGQAHAKQGQMPHNQCQFILHLHIKKKNNKPAKVFWHANK